MRDLTQEEIDLITEAYNYTVMASKYNRIWKYLTDYYTSLNYFIECMKPVMIVNKSLTKSDSIPNDTFVEFLQYHIARCKRDIPKHY